MNNVEYLKKYTKSKKHKNKNLKVNGNLKIIDEEISFNKLVQNDIKCESSADEEPVIADVIDERSEVVKQIEEYRLNNRWTLIGSKKTRKNSDSSSPADSDLSPVRKSDNISPKTIQDNISENNKLNSLSDDDLSPQRKSDVIHTNLVMNRNSIDIETTLKNRSSVLVKDSKEKIGVTKRRKTKKEELTEADKIKLEEASAKYKMWQSGIKQNDLNNIKIKEILHECEKPLARYLDDKDLDEELRNIEHADDPMLDYIRKKKKNNSKKISFPSYKGPEPPPYRFDIKPGYRWDGVDRTNGFEAKYFENLKKKKVPTATLR